MAEGLAGVRVRFPTFTGAEPCRHFDNPDDFFAVDRTVRAHEAKRACLQCGVMRECAEWGLRHEEFGIWGGLAPVEREAIRRRRRIRLVDPHMVVT